MTWSSGDLFFYLFWLVFETSESSKWANLFQNWIRYLSFLDEWYSIIKCFFSIKICRLYNPKNKRLEQTDGQFHPNISKRKVGTPIFYFIYLYFRVFSIIWKNFRKVLVFLAISHRFETKISSQNWLILYFDRDYFKEKVMRNIYFCQFYIHWTA